MKRKSESGLTVIEIMIGIAVMGIVAAVAVPAVTNWLPNFRLMKASRDLHSNFQLAKMTAVKSNSNCAVTFGQSVQGETYGYVIYQDSDNDMEYDPGERIIARTRWSDYRSVRLDTTKGGGTGVDFANNDDGLPSMAFTPSGLTRNNAAGRVFLINSNARTRSVEIMGTGNIKMHTF